MADGNIRNLLIIGYTKSGKSALANVLSNTTKFNENDYSADEFKDISINTDKFTWNEKEYRVVDTSTKLTYDQNRDNNILAKIIDEV